MRTHYIDLITDYSNLSDEELNKLIKETEEQSKSMTEWEDPDEK